MLPGFRFLFAAIMLSMSLLVFGLGAAALLRAAHESFASNSTWRAAPEVTFAQRTESTLPVLATLRVEAPAAEKEPEQAPPVVALSANSSPAMAAPAAPEQVAALRPVDAAPVESKTPETKTSEIKPPETTTSGTATSESTAPAMLPADNPPPATAPVVAETTATGAQTAIAAITPPATSPDASEPATAQPEPAEPESASAAREVPVTDQAGIAATKIATLGGPPVDIAEDTIKATPHARNRTAKPDQAKTDQSAINWRVQARRAVHRRRLAAARARLAAQAQQLANPFAPLPPPAVTAPRR